MLTVSFLSLNGGAMRSVGYYKMHRGWMDNPVLKDCEERIVWLSIIERAAWQDTQTFVNGQCVSVKRGTFFTSLRTLCGHVYWDAKKVSRFLERLEKCHMIATASDNGMTQVTVCNYDKYNPSSHTDATVVTQKVPHKERINKKEEIYIAGWDDFHSSYPSGLLDNGKPRRWPKTGRDSAQNLFKQAVASGATVVELCRAATNYAKEKADGQYVFNPKKFLKDEHWKQYLTDSSPKDSFYSSDWDYQ